jgi:hypothetical protein
MVVMHRNKNSHHFLGLGSGDGIVWVKLRAKQCYKTAREKEWLVIANGQHESSSNAEFINTWQCQQNNNFYAYERFVDADIPDDGSFNNYKMSL